MSRGAQHNRASQIQASKSRIVLLQTCISYGLTKKRGTAEQAVSLVSFNKVPLPEKHRFDVERQTLIKSASDESADDSPIRCCMAAVLSAHTALFTSAKCASTHRITLLIFCRALSCTVFRSLAKPALTCEAVSSSAFRGIVSDIIRAALGACRLEATCGDTITLSELSASSTPTRSRVKGQGSVRCHGTGPTVSCKMVSRLCSICRFTPSIALITLEAAGIPPRRSSTDSIYLIT